MEKNMGKDKKKFDTQVNALVLDELKELESKEGDQIKVPIDEALREDIESKHGPRKHVLQSFQNSMLKYDSLYKELAK